MGDMTVYQAAEAALIKGDISKLSEQERTSYYMNVCQSLGLNPLTKPFDYINLSGKLTLYARKDATDQLRSNRKVSITKLERETINGVYCVTAYAEMNGRADSSIGAVNIDGLKGDAMANAMMKAETKAKRRVTLSICGLGMLDETELETIHEIQQPTKTQPALPANTNGNGKPSWKSELLQSIAGWSGKATGDIVAVLNLSSALSADDQDELITDWVSLYINERKTGADSKTATKSADSWLVSEKAKITEATL